ncbi:uncharacterized protein LOC119325047 [Triticum dicoccoides]|uniref:uncharacterized protein LOC119325047 n=1 Tax=Triticum dicoccoides TaxID=85692 RepID=UPI001891CCD1|nr:uncharacterized protein LOC119325047 [Triticum dicoccoides]
MQHRHQAGAGCALAFLLAGVYLAHGVAPSDGSDYKMQQKWRMAKDPGLRPLAVVVVAEAAVQSSCLRPVQPCLHQLWNPLQRRSLLACSSIVIPHGPCPHLLEATIRTGLRKNHEANGPSQIDV